MITGVIHRDNWQRFLDIVLPQLLDAGLARGGLRAAQDASAERARPGPAVEQRGGTGQGAPADQHLSRHAVRPRRARHGGRPPLDHAGRREGVRAPGVHQGESDGRRQRRRAGRAGSRASRAPEHAARRGRRPARRHCRRRSRRASRSKSWRRTRVRPRSRSGFRSTSRARIADFAALSVARAWLGEHRLSSGRALSADSRGARHQLRRLRLHRGVSARDVPVLPGSERARRRRQIFEIWIRPVVPVNAHMTLRLAVHELDEPGRERPDAGGLRGDARLPDEERVRHDRAPGSAARLRARLDVVRHRRVHRLHARQAAGADASSRSTRPSNAISTPATCRSSSSPRMRPG